MRTLSLIKERYTKCDSGETLNPLMHAFLFITLVFSIAFLFFGHTATVQAVVLYQQTALIDQGFVNAWGLIGCVTMLLHTAAFWLRGTVGPKLMGLSIFGGFYLWLWASIVYLSGGFFFQFLVACLPNLWFWSWYALQRKRRVNGKRVAFV